MTTEITPGGENHALPLQMLFNVVELHRLDSKANLPVSVEMRFFVENNSQQTAQVAPASMRLMGALLQPLAPPITEPAGSIEVAPGQSATIHAHYPLRKG